MFLGSDRLIGQKYMAEDAATPAATATAATTQAADASDIRRNFNFPLVVVCFRLRCCEWHLTVVSASDGCEWHLTVV